MNRRLIPHETEWREVGRSAVVGHEGLCRTGAPRLEAARLRLGVPKRQRNGHSTRKIVVTGREIRAAGLYVEVKVRPVRGAAVARSRDQLPLHDDVTDRDKGPVLLDSER